MALLRRWDPIRELDTFTREMNRLVESIFGTSVRRPSVEEQLSAVSWAPDVDIFEDDSKFVVSVDVPGLDEKDIEVKVQDDTLYIKGERKLEFEDKKENYHRIERCYGSFQRAFTLPSNIDSSKTEAHLEKGVLKITLPKKEEAKPKAIEIKVSGESKGKKS